MIYRCLQNSEHDDFAVKSLSYRETAEQTQFVKQSLDGSLSVRTTRQLISQPNEEANNDEYNLDEAD